MLAMKAAHGCAVDVLYMQTQKMMQGGYQQLKERDQERSWASLGPGDPPMTASETVGGTSQLVLFVAWYQQKPNQSILILREKLGSTGASLATLQTKSQWTEWIKAGVDSL